MTTEKESADNADAVIDSLENRDTAKEKEKNLAAKDTSTSVRNILDDAETDEWLANAKEKKLKAQAGPSNAVGVILDDPETNDWLTSAKAAERKLAGQDVNAPRNSVRNILDDPETDEFLAKEGKILTRPGRTNPRPEAPADSHVETTGPARQHGVNTGNQPGAFSSGAPAEDLVPQDNNIDAEAGGSLPTPGEEDLVEANPVEEDDLAPNTEAMPFDAEAAQKRKEEQAQKQKKTLLLLAVILALVAVSIILAFVLGNKKEEVPAEPTASPSMAPSETPSFAPTGALDVLQGDLLNNTLEKLLDPSSPQSRAMDWLMERSDLPEMDEWRKMQLFAMATFFHAMQGPHWPTQINEGWMVEDQHECLWFSNDHGSFNSDHEWIEYSPERQATLPPICTDEERMQVVSLNGMREWQHSPDVPPEIVLLHSLTKLRLSSNYIHANLSQFLPTQFFEFENLTVVDLEKNNLAGSIPSEFGKLSALVELRLASNALTGTLPTELGLLSNATLLLTHFNQLTGRIPSEFGMLSSLSALVLAGNALTGSIPSELGLASNLEWLYFWNNQLSGSLPTEFGMLTSLKGAHLFNAGLAGTIPSEIGMLNLKHIYLWDNLLSGSIPSQIGNLNDTMDDLQVPRNTLSGQVPSELGLFSSMTILHLSGNRMTGPLPTQIGTMTSMSQLHLNENQFSGSIPSEMGAMGAMLADLNIRLNALTGTIPTELGLLTGMTSLQLYGNQLTGTIPEELFLNGTMIRLLLQNNTGLSGTLPEPLCSLGLYNPNFDLGLSFDCSEQLCGCCWCPCPGSNTSTECSSLAVDPILSSDMEWPGLFPTNSTTAININLRTDPFPLQLTLEWSQQSESGEWELVELFEPDKENAMYSYTVEMEPGSLYQLSLTDSNGDGICCDYGYGWFSITSSAPSPDHEDGTVIWSKTGEFGYDHKVVLQVDSDGNVEFLPDD